MIRFIYACATIMVLSFLVVPIYAGIAGEREAMQETNEDVSAEQDSPALEEIYENAKAAPADNSSLNQIAPAAGTGEPAANVFSTGFSNTTYPGMEADTLIIEEEILDTVTPQ
jgi:hypothetical protein